MLWRWLNRRSAAMDIALILAFAVLTCIGMMHHEPWVDETDPWLVARDMGVRDMLLHHLRYVGSPGLWYLMLVPLAKSGLPYMAEPLLHWFIAVATVGVFTFFAPFPRAFKIAFVFSAAMAYEYAVIARSYCPGIFLLFCVAALYPRRFERPYLYALPVVLLAHTHVLVFAGSVALMLGYLWEITRRHFTPSIHHYAAGALMGFGILLAALTVYPQPDDLWLGLNRFIVMRNPLAFLKILQQGFLPYLAPADVESALPLLCIRLTGVVVGLLGPAAVLYTVRRKPVAFGFLAACLLWFFYVLCFKYIMGFFRHFAYLPIFCLFALWIGAPGPFRSRRDRLVHEIALVSLGVMFASSIVTTVREYAWDYGHDFSASKKVAAFIREQHLEGRTLVSVSPASSILPFLPGTKLWFAGSHAYGSHSLWRKGTELDQTPIPPGMQNAIHQAFPDTSGLLVVTVASLGDPASSGLRLIYHQDAGREPMWVYEFVPVHPPGYP